MSGPAVPLTQPHNPPVSGAWNIAKGRGTSWGDVHWLLYPGNNTKILAETQFWWCFGEDTALSNPTVVVPNQTVLYVKAFGKPSFANHMSAAVMHR